MKIAILITGGTFDKEYNELSGALCFKQTHVPEMLALDAACPGARVALDPAGAIGRTILLVLALAIFLGWPLSFVFRG